MDTGVDGGAADRLISFVINSIDPAKFAFVSASITRAMGGGRFEIVGIHDAKSMCDGYRRGLAASRGDPVVFCHDDIELLMTDLPARLARHFERFDLIAPVGTRKLISMNWASSGSRNLVGAMCGQNAAGQFGIGYFGGSERQNDGIVAFEGVLIAARRRVAESIGWDAETFDDWHGYDTDFSFRAHLAGFRLGVVLDLAIIHRSEGTFGDGYVRSEAAFNRKHASRLSTGSGVYVVLPVPAPTRAEVVAFFDRADLPKLHRELQLRVDRSTNAAGHRPRAMLLRGAWDPTNVDVREAVVAPDPPTRNGPCTCGSGLRYKDCCGKATAARR